MKRQWCLFLFWMTLLLIVVYIVMVNRMELSRRLFAVNRNCYDHSEDFQGFDNVSGTADGCYIVPNIVHFIRFGQPEFSFVDAVCVLAALKNQRPDKIFFHTDTPNFYGKYWKVILTTPGVNGVIEVKYMQFPEKIYGQAWQKWWEKYHASDVNRLKVLMQYGGIYLDNDAYIVRDLNEFRKFEFSIGWKPGENISNQVIIAHRNARFLREWLLTYKGHYDSKSWYYNAGVRPVRVVLSKHPELVHYVGRRFAEYRRIPYMLYLEQSSAWMDHYVIHLLINHMDTMLRKNLSSEATYPVVFNEDNIKLYNVNFKDMVYDVYPFNRSV